ncbi:MAG: hypothetical protein RR356_06820, partial [Bacteroidales bacterium]
QKNEKISFRFFKTDLFGLYFGVFPVNSLINFLGKCHCTDNSRKTYEHAIFENVTVYVDDYNMVYNSDDLQIGD